MKKFLRITFVLMAILLCTISVVNAATKDELVAYLSKSFKVAGEEVKLSDSDILNVKKYLEQYPVSEGDADKIIAKVDEAVALVNKAGTTNLTKLSKAQKDELIKIAQEAASIAGATISYDNKDKVVTIYKNGEVFTTRTLDSKFVQTGSNATMYVVIALVAVIAVATVVGYRKIKNA